MRPITAISNAQAGSSEQDVVDAVLEILRTERDVRLVATASRDDLEEALADAADRTVVVLGGDGSLHAVVAVLDDLGLLGEAEVALLPLGTGNDFARTIGMDHEDPVVAARQVLAATPQSVDLVRDDRNRLVVNAVHVGLGAEAAVEAEPWKARLGVVGYALGAIISGVKHKGFRGRVLVDGEELSHGGRIIQVAVGNGRYVGGGAPLLPYADPTDGLLDVAVSWSDARVKRLGYAWRLRKGRHPTREDVAYRTGTVVSVVGEPTRGNLDGEVCDPQPSHSWRLEPGALTMLLPPR